MTDTDDQTGAPDDTSQPATETTEAPEPTGQAPGGDNTDTEDVEPTSDTEDDVAKWREMARRHEARAKSNADAAKRLPELEETLAGALTDVETLTTERDTATEERDQASARVVALEAALDAGLALADLDLVDTTTGTPEQITARITALAERIGKAATGRPVGSLGRGGTPPADPDDWLRAQARR